MRKKREKVQLPEADGYILLRRNEYLKLVSPGGPAWCWWSTGGDGRKKWWQNAIEDRLFSRSKVFRALREQEQAAWVRIVDIIPVRVRGARRILLCPIRADAIALPMFPELESAGDAVAHSAQS